MASIIKSNTYADFNGREILTANNDGALTTQKINYPAFQASITTNQSISTSSWTKVQFQTEVFDTNNTYDAVTNHRFTPAVAGKYLITASVGIDSMIDTRYTLCAVYKNGSATGYADSKARRSVNHAPTGSTLGSLISFIDTANNTDYYEVFVFHNYGSARNTSVNYYGFFGANRIGS